MFKCIRIPTSVILESTRSPLPWRIPGYSPVHRDLCSFGTKSQVIGSRKNESKPWSPIWPAVKNVTAVATQALAHERNFFPFIYSFSRQISVDSLRGKKTKSPEMNPFSARSLLSLFVPQLVHKIRSEYASSAAFPFISVQPFLGFGRV